MRNIIDENITLEEPGHKYVLETDPSIEFQSVTELIGNYFEPFDKHAIAEKLVATNPKYMDTTAEALIAKWDAARDHGTKVHSEIELYLNKSIVPDEPKARDAIEWLKKYQMKSEIDIYTEIKVYSKELKIAGSIDILAHDKRTDLYEIVDWKTSKSIDTVSFKGKTGSHPITQHLMDCKFVTYSMQLSFYRYLLETYYGIKIRNQLIGHLDGEQCKSYVGDYYKNEIVEIIHDQQNRRKS
ncbi:MAG: hypothetical protein COA72_08995 [Candidatus Neomarinimicrobiota bacterium]|jgi:hypothetical protein|nr:MAG: hypothetical protein COA72_08995 [Candidatus Neomarinimicrobiota bacterium]